MLETVCVIKVPCSVPFFFTHLTTAHRMKETAYSFYQKDELTTICMGKTPDFAD